MLKEEVLKKCHIDIKTYARECELIQKSAPFTGYSAHTDKIYSSELVHDLMDEFWNLDFDDEQLIELFFGIYEDLPSSWSLTTLCWKYIESEIKLKKIILSKLYYYLTINNRVYSRPIEYSLWCDYFEDIKLVDEVWNFLINKKDISDNVVKSLLNCSGPVPYKLKEGFYINLINKKEYHSDIFNSIKFSVFDYFGQIDKKKAKKILKKLKIDKKNIEYKMVIDKINEK